MSDDTLSKLMQVLEARKQEGPGRRLNHARSADEIRHEDIDSESLEEENHDLVSDYLRPRGDEEPDALGEQVKEGLLLWAHSGALKPSADEVTRNPRARSARLRAAVRAGA